MYMCGLVFCANRFEDIFKKNWKNIILLLTDMAKGSRILIRQFENVAWEYSSAGRAPALQAGGHRFEPCYSHQFLIDCGITVDFLMQKKPSAQQMVFFAFDTIMKNTVESNCLICFPIAGLFQKTSKV